MIRMFLNKGVCFGLILLGFSSLFVGCANQIPEDELVQISNTVSTGFKAFTRESLILADENFPELTPGIMGDLEIATTQIGTLASGDITAEGVADVLTALFERINARAALVDDSIAGKILRGFADVAEMVSGYFQTYTIPNDVKVIALSIKAGIEVGVEEYKEIAASNAIKNVTPEVTP